MPSVIEKITALVAAFTVLVVALSVSHELGYFAYIGGRFFQTFLTVSDYFTNALLWLPFAALTAVGWLNYDWIWKQTPKPKKGIWTSWIVPALIVSIPLLFFIFVSEGPPTFYFMLFLYLWILFSDRFLGGAEVEAPLLTDLLKLVKVAVPVCMGLFTLGYTDAKSDLTSFTGAYSIEIEGQDQPILRIPLRNFEKGLLARDPVKHTVVFIRWDTVKSVSKSSDPLGTPTLGCWWFNISCKLIDSPL